MEDATTKGNAMWVYDGETWTQEGGSNTPTPAKPDTAHPQRFDEFVPELQVIEILPIPQKKPVPPFPMA
jgi:hypothetical protein